MFGFSYKPSKKKIREFIEKMNKIDKFCKEHGIARTIDSDSYYFIVNGQQPYRVSNSISAHLESVYDPVSDNRVDTDENNTIYIHASKTRIIDIFNDLCAGYKLDGHGRRKEEADTK